MKNFLIIFQIAVSILLVITILSQEKGTGLSATFGGSSQFFSGRRGVDKVLLWATVILTTLFVAASLAFIFLPDSGQPLDVSTTAEDSQAQP